MNVSVRDLKSKLSRYLRDARAGQDVVVTSRGQPIVRLLAITDEKAKVPTPQEILRRLELFPGVQLGEGGKPLGATRPVKAPPGEKTLSEIVSEGRG